MKKFKRNFWQGYKGTKGTKLDQTESELYDDIPPDDIQEQMLKLLAGGQIAEERRRAAYYDTEDNNTNPEDIEEVDAGTSAEEFDYVTAYKTYRERKIALWKAAQEQIKKAEEPQPKQQPEEQPKQQPEEKK